MDKRTQETLKRHAESDQVRIDTARDREIASKATDCPIKMIEIYGGKDEQWAGWHNLLINDEGGFPIAGPLNPELSAPLLEIIAAVDERDALVGTLQKINNWCEAYPLDMFPEPDFKKAAVVLKENGITIDAISASNMRHVLKGIQEIISQSNQEPNGGCDE